MSFDFSKFEMTDFHFPTKKIPVPGLKDFFSDTDREPVWEIKGLTGEQLAEVNEAVSIYGKTKAIVSALASGSDAQLKKGIQTLLNKSDEFLPEDLIRRHKILQLGSIEECPEEVSVKLACYKPTTFYNITNEIIQLTGEGAEPGE